MNLNQLKAAIDSLTLAMAKNVADEKLEDIARLTEQRMALIVELIALHPAQISTEELRGCLTALRARDQGIRNEICRLQKQLQGSLSNFGNVREYLVF